MGQFSDKKKCKSILTRPAVLSNLQTHSNLLRWVKRKYVLRIFQNEKNTFVSNNKFKIVIRISEIDDGILDNFCFYKFGQLSTGIV